MKIGSHISFKKPNYLIDAVEDSIKNGANTMMIYFGGPQSSRTVDKKEIKFEEYMEKYSKIIKPIDIVVHAPYITNPANPEKKDWANEHLIKDMKTMQHIGAKHLVLHPGSHTKYDRQLSIDTLVESLKYIFSKTEFVEISIETMAGKGTEIGTTFKELKYIVDKVNNKRLNICLDTCHVWDSGVDLNNLDQVMNDLKKYDLLKLIKVIHVNDSKNILGAAKDRHENIGEGYIGLKSLKKIVHAPEFENALMILETPWVDGNPIYDKEIKLLK